MTNDHTNESLRCHIYRANFIIESHLKDGAPVYVAVHLHYTSRKQVGPRLRSVEESIRSLIDSKLVKLNALPKNPCFFFKKYVESEDRQEYFAKYDGAYDFQWEIISVLMERPQEEDLPEESYRESDEWVSDEEREYERKSQILESIDPKEWNKHMDGVLHGKVAETLPPSPPRLDKNAAINKLYQSQDTYYYAVALSGKNPADYFNQTIKNLRVLIFIFLWEIPISMLFLAILFYFFPFGLSIRYVFIVFVVATLLSILSITVAEKKEQELNALPISVLRTGPFPMNTIDIKLPRTVDTQKTEFIFTIELPNYIAIQPGAIVLQNALISHVNRVLDRLIVRDQDRGIDVDTDELEYLLCQDIGRTVSEMKIPVFRFSVRANRLNSEESKAPKVSELWT
jgi:hypothetical protein